MDVTQARVLMAAGGGLLTGVGLTWAEAKRRLERANRQKLQDEIASHKRVLEKAAESFLAKEMGIDGPYQTEDDLDGPDTSDDSINVGGEMIQETPVADTALSDVTPSADYLATARDYSPSPASAEMATVEYITEDDFHEEDGREKEQILIHMGENEPLFIIDGVAIIDWDTLISPNILVDMYQRVPPGAEVRVLYVRNHRNHTDYEVIQEVP